MRISSPLPLRILRPSEETPLLLEDRAAQENEQEKCRPVLKTALANCGGRSERIMVCQNKDTTLVLLKQLDGSAGEGIGRVVLFLRRRDLGFAPYYQTTAEFTCEGDKNEWPAPLSQSVGEDVAASQD